ncbi:MAG: ATP-grasp domain-containing protein [Methanosarcinaceae archaeon]
MENILVIGYSTRNIVCSARRAGYNVYSIDAFTDSDLVECASGSQAFDLGKTVDIKTISREKIDELIDSLGVDFDAIVLGSGFEMMDLTSLSCPILNNSPRIMQEVSDKENFAKKLVSMDLPHPHTYDRSIIGNIRYPVMVKPKCAGGGRFNRVFGDVDELNTYLDDISNMGTDTGINMDISADDMLIQEYVSGVPLSVSIISTKNSAVAAAVNEQMIGVPWLTKLPFAYCGNITPYKTPYTEKMCRMAEDLILKLGLVGSNGVDFILTGTGPVIIEVNARFQGSMDTVELATGINLFDAHVKAFTGELLPEIQMRPEIKQYAARVIMYAEKRLMINDLAINGLRSEPVVDIPNSGYMADVNEPLMSILHTGTTRDNVMINVKKSVCAVRKIIGENTFGDDK